MPWKKVVKRDVFPLDRSPLIGAFPIRPCACPTQHKRRSTGQDAKRPLDHQQPEKMGPGGCLQPRACVPPARGMASDTWDDGSHAYTCCMRWGEDVCRHGRFLILCRERTLTQINVIEDLEGAAVGEHCSALCVERAHEDGHGRRDKRRWGVVEIRGISALRRTFDRRMTGTNT